MSPLFIKAQEKQRLYSIDVNHSMGHFLLNSEFPDNISHITQNTVISWNKNTFGTKEWQRNYNYPTYGVLFSYQNNTPSFLGDLYSVMVHYTHYLYKRKISIKIADGLAFASKIYDKKDNPRNIFLTSKLLNGFYFATQYKEENLWKNIGFQAGVSFTHYSNGSIMYENKGLNSYFVQVGLNYSLGKKEQKFNYSNEKSPFDKSIHYNFVYRGGVNENASGIYDYFYVLSFYANKQVDNKRNIQIGCDYFVSNFVKEYAKEEHPHETPDYKRFGIFIGHEFVMQNFAFPIQLGYYVYNPSGFESNYYQRLGAKYHFHKNICLSVALKTHFERAEAIEFGLGFKL